MPLIQTAATFRLFLFPGDSTQNNFVSVSILNWTAVKVGSNWFHAVDSWPVIWSMNSKRKYWQLMLGADILLWGRMETVIVLLDSCLLPVHKCAILSVYTVFIIYLRMSALLCALLSLFPSVPLSLFTCVPFFWMRPSRAVQGQMITAWNSFFGQSKVHLNIFCGMSSYSSSLCEVLELICVHPALLLLSSTWMSTLSKVEKHWMGRDMWRAASQSYRWSQRYIFFWSTACRTSDQVQRAERCESFNATVRMLTAIDLHQVVTSAIILLFSNTFATYSDIGSSQEGIKCGKGLQSLYSFAILWET